MRAARPAARLRWMERFLLRHSFVEYIGRFYVALGDSGDKFERFWEVGTVIQNV